MPLPKLMHRHHFCSVWGWAASVSHKTPWHASQGENLVYPATAPLLFIQAPLTSVESTSALRQVMVLCAMWCSKIELTLCSDFTSFTWKVKLPFMWKKEKQPGYSMLFLLCPGWLWRTNWQPTCQLCRSQHLLSLFFHLANLLLFYLGTLKWHISQAAYVSLLVCLSVTNEIKHQFLSQDQSGLHPSRWRWSCWKIDFLGVGCSPLKMSSLLLESPVMF